MRMLLIFVSLSIGWCGTFRRKVIFELSVIFVSKLVYPRVYSMSYFRRFSSLTEQLWVDSSGLFLLCFGTSE